MKHALKNVRLIAFDLDDTLYPELSFVAERLQGCCPCCRRAVSTRAEIL